MVRHKWADVIHAWAEGKEIQWRFINCDWEELPLNRTPEFNNTQSEWRVKPEPKPDIIGTCIVGLGRDGVFQVQKNEHCPNVRVTFDGETKKLKSVELIGD